MSLDVDRETGKVQVVYARKKFATVPIFCQIEVDGGELSRIACPEALVVVMYLCTSGRPLAKSLG